MLVPTYPTTLFILKLFLFLYLQGLNVLELASHLEEKAAQLRCEGLGRIKLVLAGTDISSLLGILEGHFGHVDLDTSKSTISTEKSEKEVAIEEKPSDVPEKIPATPSDIADICHDHLNVALACLYCSFKNNPKM